MFHFRILRCPVAILTFHVGISLSAWSPVAYGEDAKKPNIEELVKQLSSDDFETRKQAVPALIAAGLPAVKSMEEAAQGPDLELRFHAVSVLAALSRTTDDAIVAAARKALEGIAAGKYPDASGPAKDALKFFVRPDQMRKLALQFPLAQVRDGQKKKLELGEKSIHRFVDVDRYVTDGTLWVFGKGRPAAVIEVYPAGPGNDEDVWYSAITSLSAYPLASESIDGVEGRDWSPEPWQGTFEPFSKAPQPASAADDRLSEMQALSRRFTAHQFWQPGETRYELDVLPAPVLRYSDEKEGLVDGGLFLIVHDVNPEVLLLLEVQATKGTTAWKYALAPLGSARMHVQLDKEEVWTCPTPKNVIGGGKHPYWALQRTLVK